MAYVFRPASAPRRSVSETSRTPIPDQAQQMLSQSPYGELHSAVCESRDGVVVIRGRVSSFYLKQIAQSVVQKLPGVLRVDNRLEVEPT